jgi:hypothetical protein
MSVNPFDIKTVLLAKHAQHVALIHFPIALFIAAVAFDYLGQWTKNRTLAAAAYFNLLLAAISTVPVVASGLVAWQWALEGSKAKRHPVDASDLGMHIEYVDLAGVLDPLAGAASGKIIATVPATDRSARGLDCGDNGTSRRISQWCKRNHLDAADQLQRALGITDVNYLLSSGSSAIINSPFGASGLRRDTPSGLRVPYLSIYITSRSGWEFPSRAASQRGDRGLAPARPAC